VIDPATQRRPFVQAENLSAMTPQATLNLGMIGEENHNFSHRLRIAVQGWATGLTLPSSPG
jgi:hypothetical protein